ncbi:TlpA family protein disulfide reductase [Flavobacterium johnsoniae]|uniref:Thioredoxin domain-containing protein n=1 Tax=Flavobacterium johnsoniae TaxID=986 RepID=A0A1J7BP38_FLAJO|nr:TlpA disulfide reductase family protein [Flavobacterium johnsoniae]OIV40459.1 hypothetical protein BKM63_16350 [Flavobacterium johnsoniae]
MLKHIFTLLFFIYSGNFFSQNSANIQGKILTDKNYEKDTIVFSAGIIDEKYYANTKLTSAINNNKFNIQGIFSCPQMYSYSMNSEKDVILFRNGKYFIDQSTTSIIVSDMITKQGEVIGKTGNEYQNKFIPFILANSSDNFEHFYYNNSEMFDKKLYKYVIKNPDSYVALWFLIERYNIEGYSDLYETTLNSFSHSIKKQKLWLTLNAELKNTLIRKGRKFPEMSLQNTSLKTEILNIPDSKYTLIEFWFSRCRPCLEQLPSLKKIYNRYYAKSFNIIAISTDKTQNVVPYWQKRIVEYEIPWKNYLDENAVIAAREKIISFPTNFLIDKDHNVIKKNITPEDLEKFLSENL